MELPTSIHYCAGCKKRHSEDDWRWHEKKVKRKIIRWCHECIDCYGCQTVHRNDSGGSRIDSRGEICRKWYASPPKSFKQKIKSMSTEEVLSGTMHGLPNQFKSQSEDYTPQVKQQQRKTVLEALQ